MAVFKRVLCKQRLRQVPPQFSWVDHRLVRDRHISRCSSDALALYLFLVTVADGQGLSYYADKTICRLLPALGGGSLSAARAQLIANHLIAYQPPLYQVLAIGPDFGEPGRAAPASPPPQPRSLKRTQSMPRPGPAPDGEGPHPLARILRELAGLDPTPASPGAAPVQKPLDSTQDKPFGTA
jgi:hypothetical protein